MLRVGSCRLIKELDDLILYAENYTRYDLHYWYDISKKKM